MSKIKDETIQKMEALREKLDARIQLLKNRKDAEEKKKDVRRKILAGAYFISIMENDLSKIGQCLKDANYLRQRDENLFFFQQKHE